MFGRQFQPKEASEAEEEGKDNYESKEELPKDFLTPMILLHSEDEEDDVE